MGVYVFALANQMQNHQFCNDVAITRTISKKQAIKRFKELYAVASEENVVKIGNLTNRVIILTDY